jgi:hypothetical protein
MLAVAILAITLSSLLGSQVNAMRATQYARDVSVAAFLAEAQLIELEFQLRQDGWGTADQEFDGTFSEQGNDDIHYQCKVDMPELPEYQQLVVAKEAGETDGPDDNVQDVAEQGFSMLGVVWPMIKTAIEESIRKASCTVKWKTGEAEHDFEVMTYWVDLTKLRQATSILGGGEGEGEDEGDDADSPDDPPKDPGGPGGRPGSGPGGGSGRERPSVGGGVVGPGGRAGGR